MNIDIIIIFAYFIIINLIGLKYSGSKSMNDYFLGGRSVPWVIASLSIVATETSSLTFISIPGLAYVKGMGFLQVAFGYLIGRIFVAVILIPKYFEGNIETVYQFIHTRFGISSRRMISVIFHVTRLLADSVRLFATSIPLTVMTGWDYRVSLLVIGIATFIYTYFGGFKAVAVTDAVQLFIYIIAAFLGMYIIYTTLAVPLPDLFSRIPGDSLRVLFSGFEEGSPGPFKSYNIFSGVIGGAFLSFASHGTDHLIVQRVLSCKNEGAAKKAMVLSGVIIVFQFALFLLFGLFIKVLFEGRPFDRSDDIIPFFIIHHLPAGVKGIMLAGIFAAAMSTLASSINSLSSSTCVDLLRLDEKTIPEERKLRISKMLSLVWTIVIIGISILLSDTKNPLVEIGLEIASVTYGSMMGIFILARFFRDFSDRAALAGVLAGIIANLIIILTLNVFWLWYVVIGFFVTVLTGIVADRLFRKKPGLQA